MTLSLTKPGGWGVSTKFRSSEATALDQNTIKALDKTAAGDTLLGIVTLASGAGIVAASGSAITLNSGGAINALLGSNINLSSGSAITLASGATLTIGGTDRIALAARARTTTSIDCGVSTCDTTTKLAHFGIIDAGWIQQGIEAVASAALHWRLRAIEGMTSITVQIGMKGAGHGSLPATKPRLSIFRHNLASTLSAPTEVAFQDDGAGSVGAYETNHILTCSVSAVNTTSYYYTIRLKGESGANSLAGGLSVDRLPTVVATYARMNEEF